MTHPHRRANSNSANLIETRARTLKRARSTTATERRRARDTLSFSVARNCRYPGTANSRPTEPSRAADHGSQQRRARHSPLPHPAQLTFVPSGGRRGARAPRRSPPGPRRAPRPRRRCRPWRRVVRAVVGQDGAVVVGLGGRAGSPSVTSSSSARIAVAEADELVGLLDVADLGDAVAPALTACAARTMKNRSAARPPRSARRRDHRAGAAAARAGVVLGLAGGVDEGLERRLEVVGMRLAGRVAARGGVEPVAERAELVADGERVGALAADGLAQGDQRPPGAVDLGALREDGDEQRRRAGGD